jgi:ribonuclease HI
MLKLYTDAAVKGNPGLAGVGIVVAGDGIYEQLAIPLQGEWNNHDAEWEALYLGLQWLIEHNYTDRLLSIYTDSKIVANSIQKKYAKKESYKIFLNRISRCLEEFTYSEIAWLPEKENKGADNLAKQALRKAEKTKK